MIRSVVVLAGCAATYGFAVGSVHSTVFAVRNLVKFPLLLVVTAIICLPVYHLVARFFATGLSFAQVRALVTGMIRDLSVMLASLASVGLFLAHTMERPGAAGLGDYPLFLAINVAFMAAGGTVSLALRARALLGDSRVAAWKSAVVLCAWLGVSLLVGGQWAWYLRPFFGVATIPAEATPFCLGTEADFRGARSFYEALYHLARPPVASASAARGASRERADLANKSTVALQNWK